MQHKQFRLSILFLFGLGMTGLQAQESINTTGGNALGSGGSVSYSVGQIFYTKQTGTYYSVSEGVQHPYEISVVAVPEDINGINLSILAYPNPATDHLTLEVKDIVISDATIQLYSISGKLLQSQNLAGTETKIDMSSYMSSTYFLKVIKDKKVVKSFKIVKTKNI